MIKLSEYVNEHFVNGTNKTQIKELLDKYYPQIKEVIDDGYRDIGGAIGFGDKESILNESDFCKLYRDKDGNILAVSFYADKRHPNRHQLWLKDDRKQNRGRKICCCAARKGYSEYLKKILVEDFKITNRNVWGEFSSKAATFAIKCGALPIPVNVAQSILSDKIFSDKKDDGYFYTREIGDEKQKHTKILMGNHLFYSHNIDEKLTEEEIQKFKELAKKYEVEDKELNHI